MTQNISCEVLELLRKIPRGKVATYGSVARACGTSPRAVGRILARNTDTKKYPCYKVVSVRGELRGYSGVGGLKGKEKLLRADGVTFDKNKKVSLHHVYHFN